MYQGTLTMILRYLFRNLCSISIFFYFILGIITSFHFARHLVIHFIIYGSLAAYMLSSVCPIKLQYDQVHES